MGEVSSGNVNHLSKSESLHYSCEVLVLMSPNAYQLLSCRPSEIIPENFGIIAFMLAVRLNRNQ